jgi:hypothetical protein
MAAIATLDDLAKALDEAIACSDLFPHDLKADYRRLANLCHPDRFLPGPDQVRAQEVFQRLQERYEQASLQTSLRFVQSPQREYVAEELLGRGDLADVYLALAEDQRYVLKVCRPSGGEGLLVSEFRTLRSLTGRSAKLSYRHYLPTPVESFIALWEGAPARINVFQHQSGLQTLESIRRQCATGLAAPHLAWLFKRLLVVAGLAHECGSVHGGILPPHALVRTEGHGLMLVDWTQSVGMGCRLRVIPTLYRAWYPPEVLNREPATAATDIYLVGKCLLYAAGGDPVAETWPNTVPVAMREFVNTCLYPLSRMRPQNAWRLHDEFDALLDRLFGLPQYHPLKLA